MYECFEVLKQTGFIIETQCLHRKFIFSLLYGIHTYVWYVYTNRYKSAMAKLCGMNHQPPWRLPVRQGQPVSQSVIQTVSLSQLVQQLNNQPTRQLLVRDKQAAQRFLCERKYVIIYTFIYLYVCMFICTKHMFKCSVAANKILASVLAHLSSQVIP